MNQVYLIISDNKLLAIMSSKTKANIAVETFKKQKNITGEIEILKTTLDQIFETNFKELLIKEKETS